MRFPHLARIALVALLALAVAGCGLAEEPEPEITPALEPPVIGEEGVLRVGVDLDHPPFGGVDKGREAGIDVDIASAIAKELGLEVELVEVEYGGGAAALDAGVVDIVMSATLTEETVVQMSFAGFYAASGPALFSSAETTVSPDSLGGLSIAVQEGSEAYWKLAYDLGEDRLTITETLREAFELLQVDEIDVVAGDAFVGAYMVRDFDAIAFSAQLAPATSLGVAVAPDATELSAAIRETLDALAAGGVLETIRAKWVGDLPALEGATDEDA